MLVVDPKIDKLSFLEGAGAVGSKCGGICAGSDGRRYCLCRIYICICSGIIAIVIVILIKPCVFVDLFLDAEGVATV